MKILYAASEGAPFIKTGGLGDVAEALPLELCKIDGNEIVVFLPFYKAVKENKKSMNTASIFREICSLLELDDSEYSNKIGDYYTSLTTDKRFILLDNAEWDLRDKHSVNIIIDTEDEDDGEDGDEDSDDTVVETVEAEDIDEMEEEEGIDQDDDMEDLIIIDDEELGDE